MQPEKIPLPETQIISKSYIQERNDIFLRTQRQIRSFITGDYFGLGYTSIYETLLAKRLALMNEFAIIAPDLYREYRREALIEFESLMEDTSDSSRAISVDLEFFLARNPDTLARKT